MTRQYQHQRVAEIEEQARGRKFTDEELKELLPLIINDDTRSFVIISCGEGDDPGGGDTLRVVGKVHRDDIVATFNGIAKWANVGGYLPTLLGTAMEVLTEEELAPTDPGNLN